MSSFDVKKHLSKIKGKDYLETKWRILWLRTEHPDWSLHTEVLQTEPYPLVKAVIVNQNGITVATGHGSAQPKPNTVYSGRELEKAETAAIGRACAHAGYGTQFVDEDEDEVVDSPVQRTNAAPPRTAWTVDEIREFVKSYRSAKIGDQEVLAALKVDGLKAWTGTLAQAQQALDDYIAAHLHARANDSSKQSLKFEEV